MFLLRRGVAWRAPIRPQPGARPLPGAGAVRVVLGGELGGAARPAAGAARRAPAARGPRHRAPQVRAKQVLVLR